MNPSDGLWKSVRSDQDQALVRAAYLSEAKTCQARLRRSSRGRVRRWWISSASAFALACTLAFTLSSHRRDRRDLSFSIGLGGDEGRVGAWIAAPSGGPLPLRFSDGTVFSLSAESRARVSAIDANGAHIVIERGRASASVAHRVASHWLVAVGPFEVAVVGTRFDVSWDSNDEVFRLALHEGAVLVSGSCLRQPKPIVRGQALRVLCKGGEEEIVETRGDASGLGTGPGTSGALATEDTPAADSPSAVIHAPSSPEPMPTVGSPLEPASAESSRQTAALRAPSSLDVIHSNAWKTLTSTGRFREALALVERSGFDEQCHHASGEDLLELGDAARFAGSPSRARQAYLAARAKLPGAGRSAYGLGLTAFDQQKDFAEAARWFEIYLHEQPDGRLHREAEGRLIEAWQRAGDQDMARKAAEQYLRDYPNGTQAPLARQLTTR